MAYMSKIFRKIDKFKYFVINIITYPWKKANWFHNQLCQINESKLIEAKDTPQNIYQIFGAWLIQVIGYGCLFTFIYTNIFVVTITQSIRLIFMFGLARWLVMDLIKGVRKAIIEND